MCELNNAEFYAQRERQERALAARAENPAIRNIHLELADSYVELTARARNVPERVRLRLVG